ncbi:tetratricopeptide repeat protein [bacterium]|nr:MAG: tetratricopeptide repeat protein [bacterium]
MSGRNLPLKSFVVLCGILAVPASFALAQDEPAPKPAPAAPANSPAPANPPAPVKPEVAPVKPAPVVKPEVAPKAPPKPASATAPAAPAKPASAPATPPAVKPPVLPAATPAKPTVAPETTPAKAPTTPETTPGKPPVAPETPATVTPPATTGAPSNDTERLRLATAAYNAGLAALKKSDWNAAAMNFEKATQLSPSDVGALSFLGFVRLQQKQWDTALTALQSAQDNAKDLDVRSRAQLLNNIGFAHWNKGELPEAKTAFEGALELDKGYTDARYNLAFALLSNSDFKDALPHLKLLATATPNDATVQDGMGDALNRTGNAGAALGAYKRATILAPKNVDYSWKFALALIKANRPADATTQLRQVLQIDPTNAPALLQIGDLHLKSGRFGDAATVLKRYVQLKSEDFTGRFNLGVAYDYTPKFDEALEQYAIAEKLRPTDAATKNNIGRIYFKRGKFEDAIAKFNEALKIDPNFPDARTNLAIVLAAQEKWEDSNAQWQTLALNAENSLRGAQTVQLRTLYSSRAATAHSGLANNFLAQKEYQKAIDEYRRLLTVAPNDLEARSGLGRALYSNKDYAGAATAYKAIITAAPKNADAWNDLGVALEAQRDRKGALDAYSEAVEIAPNHAEAKSNLARLKNAAPIG